MSVRITQAEQNDLNDLLVLIGEFVSEVSLEQPSSRFQMNKQRALSRLPDFLDHPDYGAFIARTPKGHLLGFCTLFAMPVQLREEPYAYLERLYVRKDFRRRGIAKALCAQAKKFARSRKSKRIEVKMSAYYRIESVYQFFKSEHFYETGGHKLKIAV